MSLKSFTRSDNTQADSLDTMELNQGSVTKRYLGKPPVLGKMHIKIMHASNQKLLIIQKNFKVNDGENTIYQNVQDRPEAVVE